MKILAIVLCLILTGLYACAQHNYSTLVEDVEIITEDNIKLYGDFARKNDTDEIVLLFHQGGSNVRGEYKNILPRLFAEGYNVLATDLRSGGETYGFENRTTEHLEKEYEYCQAQRDIQAVINYVNKKGYKNIILWGSSFSGSLVIRAVEGNEQLMKGVVAFSPASGGPMAICRPDEMIKKTKVKLIVFRPKRELEIESVQQQFELLDKYGHDTHVAENGIHGASMLDKERVQESTNKEWERVLEFIESL